MSFNFLKYFEFMKTKLYIFSLVLFFVVSCDMPHPNPPKNSPKNIKALKARESELLVFEETKPKPKPIAKKISKPQPIKKEKEPEVKLTTNIIAIVNNSPINKSEFEKIFPEDKLDKLPNFLRREYDQNRSKFIEQLINSKTIACAADEYDFSNFPEYQKELEKVTKQLKIRYFYNQEIIDKIKTNPKEIKNFYDNNENLYVAPERVRTKHILVEVKKGAHPAEVSNALEKARKIRQRVLEGEDFSKVAIEVSDCPSGPKGGDLGFFQSGQMVPTFEQAAFNLEKNEISDVIKTEFGFHIIKLSDKIPKRRQAFKEVKTTIETNLQKQKEQKLYNNLLNSLTNKYKVIKNEKLIKELVRGV